MRADLIDGWVQLAGSFPPSLNTATDAIRLKPFESPVCYGVDCGTDGILKPGSVPTGTDKTSTSYTVGSRSFTQWYNRLWYATGSTLFYGAPEYTDKFVRQGLSSLTCPATIVTFLPCLQNSMWVGTGSGSQLINGTTDARGYYELAEFFQEMFVASSSNALVLDAVPFVSNISGIFSFDGDSVKEWTRPVRYSLGSFTATEIKANYPRGWIIGTSKFVLDTQTGKLFDYGTSGFRFTTRTLSQLNAFNPFEILAVAFIYKQTDTAGATISWQTQIEDGDWTDEPDASFVYQAEEYTRKEFMLQREQRVGHRFAVRLIAMSSTLELKEIQVCVRGLAQGSMSE